MTNTQSDADYGGRSQRLDRIEALVESNAKSIEALSADVAANRADIAGTNQKFDALLQMIAESNVRSEARLNRLDDAVIGIERIFEQLIRKLP